MEFHLAQLRELVNNLWKDVAFHLGARLELPVSSGSAVSKKTEPEIMG